MTFDSRTSTPAQVLDQIEFPACGVCGQHLRPSVRHPTASKHWWSVEVGCAHANYKERSPRPPANREHFILNHVTLDRAWVAAQRSGAFPVRWPSRVAFAAGAGLNVELDGDAIVDGLYVVKMQRPMQPTAGSEKTIPARSVVSALALMSNDGTMKVAGPAPPTTSGFFMSLPPPAAAPFARATAKPVSPPDPGKLVEHLVLFDVLLGPVHDLATNKRVVGDRDAATVIGAPVFSMESGKLGPTRGMVRLVTMRVRRHSDDAYLKVTFGVGTHARVAPPEPTGKVLP